MVGTYLSIFRRRARLIAVLTAVLAPLAFLAMTLGAETYRSEALLLVGAGNVADGVLGQAAGYEEPERRMATEVEVIEGRGVAERAAAQLQEQGWDEGADDLAERVEAAPRGLSSALEIVGTDSDPERARALTQAFVDGYAEYRRNSQRAALEEVEAELAARLAAVEEELASPPPEGEPEAVGAALEAASAQYQTISGWLEEVRFRLSGDPSGVEVLAPASTPEEPEGLIAAPVALVVSLLGAFLLACGVALVVDLLRDAVRTAAEAEALVAQPVLVEVPRAGVAGLPAALADPAHPTAVAARGLRLRLEDLAGGTTPSGILVAGPAEDGADTGTVGAALAVAHARAGQRTLLVADGSDLLPEAPGGSAAVTSRGAPAALPTGLEQVWQAPATSRPDGAVGLLDGFSPRPALAELGEAFDVLVVVMPAASALSEIVAVGRATETGVLVCALGRSGSKPLRRLALALAQGDVPLSGMVLTTDADGAGGAR